MEVEERGQIASGWLTGAAICGVTAALMPQAAACTLGWAGLLLGMTPALLLPRATLPPRWEKTVRLLRCLWAVAAMAVGVQRCATGLTAYSYPGWQSWVPAGLLLLLAWRGSRLDAMRLERLGKLLFWLLAAMGVSLLAFTAPRIRWSWLAVSGWGDVKAALRIALLTAGASVVLVPSGGVRPGLAAVGLSGAACAVTTGAEGAALAARLAYPFLTLCDAAVFTLRLSGLGSALWALSAAALLIRLLSWFPKGRLIRGAACAAAFALFFWMPWSAMALTAHLVVGAVLGYLPALWSMLRRPQNYI